MEVQPAIDIRVGHSCPELGALLDKHSSRCWAFITAWNPGSKKLDAAENQRRQAALEAEATQRGYIAYRGAGVPDGQDWEPEESILIVGIDREDAVKLGWQYGQAAIVVGERDTIAELVFVTKSIRNDNRGGMAILDETLAVATQNKRVCPQPQRWQELYDLLPDRVRKGGGWEPALPLILAAWHEAPTLLKMLRLREHIEWAAEHGCLDEVHSFLCRLSEDDWHHMGE